MNKIISILSFMLLACGIQACAQKESENPQTMKDKNVLVVFYSRIGDNYAVGNISKGNTHIVAEMIADKTGGRLFEIEPVNPYPEDYTECTEVAKREKEEDARPAIKNDIPVEDYDVIFIGYPIWWGDAPMPLHTFIDKHNWNGKIVIPFCTHEGSGLAGTEEIMRNSCKGSTVLRGLAIKGTVTQNQQDNARNSINSWLDGLNF